MSGHGVGVQTVHSIASACVRGCFGELLLLGPVGSDSKLSVLESLVDHVVMKGAGSHSKHALSKKWRRCGCRVYPC